MNRWLHFQPIAPIVVKPDQASDIDAVPVVSPPVVSTITPNQTKYQSPAGSSEWSFEPDQHWDGYQEIYSNDGSSVVDFSAAEKLLHFGDNYSDLLRKSVDNVASTAPPSETSVSPVFHDESNANAQLDDSFLLSGYTKSLELSALKSIDEIFDFKELHSNAAGTYGAIEWIDPNESPRRSPSGTSCSQSTLSTNSRQRTESTLATSNYFSAMDTGQNECLALDSGNENTSRSMSMESLLDDLHDKTLVPQKSRSNTTTPPAAKSPSNATPVDQPTVKPKRVVHKARRRKTAATSPTSIATNRSPPVTTSDINANIKDMQPDDVRRIMATCQSHLDCLNHVLLSQTVNSIVQHPAMNVNSCDAAKLTDRTCRCGPIARFVQSMIDFLLDLTNSFRHFRLYQLFVRSMRQLYGMVQTISADVRRQRMQMNSIEFVL